MDTPSGVDDDDDGGLQEEKERKTMLTDETSHLDNRHEDVQNDKVR